MSKVKDRNSDEEIEIEDIDPNVQSKSDSAITHDKKDR